MTVDPYGRTTRRGVLLNNRTVEMLEVAEMHWLRSYAPLVLTQGSYSTSVSQSGGTHDGGGALDVRARDLTGSQRDSVVTALRKQGFAAWLRTPSQGDWPYHIHAIAIGDKELSPAAKQQVTDYKNGLNGLANKGADDGPQVTWTEYRQGVDLSYYGPEKWDGDDWKEFRRQIQAIPITDAVSEAAGDTMALDDVLANDRKRLYDTKTLVNEIKADVDKLVEAGKAPPPA